MRAALFAPGRPEPSHALPVAGSAVVVVVALPVFLLAGWSLAGWGLAAALWVAVHALDLVLTRARRRTGNLAASSVAVFGLFFKAIAVLVVLVAAAAAHPKLALAAALVYGLAYTFELGLSLFAYYGTSA